MSVEELLKPRYKVIADYPMRAYNIGDIITLQEPFKPIAYGAADCNNAGYLDKYPHLFKPLAWYEEREIDDLPIYLKSKNTGAVTKIEQYHQIGKMLYVIYITGHQFIMPEYFLPATSTDYQNYQSKK